MKRLAAMTLALVMCLGMVSCGDSGSDSGSGKETEKAPASTQAPAEDGGEEGTEAPETTTEEVTTVPLNTNVVNATFNNNVAFLSASFDVANIEGFETKEGTRNEDAYFATGSYGYPDPEWYSSAISIFYELKPMSGEHVEDLAEKKESYNAYDKVDLGSVYDTYMMKTESSYGDMYDIIFVGDSFLDGAVAMKFQVLPQLESGKMEDVELIVDTLARSLKLEGDESALKTADGFSLAQGGVTCNNKATVAGQQVDMEQSIFYNSTCISADTVFTVDGISYSFYTYAVDDLSNFGKAGGGEYADVTLAGKPGKIKVSGGVGTLEVRADVQIDDEHILHMAITSDSALQQGELSDAVKLGETFKTMLSDENKEATQELFAGYFNDILASFQFS